MFKYLNVLGKNEEPIHLQPNKSLGHSLLSIKDKDILKISHNQDYY
jgi:hypothetical protein